MASRKTLGGVIHTYQRYDPAKFPSPTQPPPDVVGPAFEHMLMFGSMRDLTPEELARAVHIDPSQIAGLGPSLDALIQRLRERKAKILATYETDTVGQLAFKRFRQLAARAKPPANLRNAFHQAVRQEQLRDLERIWYRSGDDRGPFARLLVQLLDRLGDKYQVDELAAKYDFTGQQGLTVPKALEVKEELEMIDRLLEQLEKARDSGQIALIDMDALAEFAEPGDMDQLTNLQRQIQEYLKQLAEQQGLEQQAGSYQLTPKAYRLFQGRLLERIFSALQASRTGRHSGAITGDGAVELQTTESYEFGDSLAHLDIPASMVNAMVRTGPGLPIRMKTEDMEVHRTRNTPKCATAVLLDMSGSMRHGGQYINAKRMGLALEGLIRREFPGDFLQFLELASFARPVRSADVVRLMPKPVTVYDHWVHLRADMSDPDISELDVPPHFTNIQHGLRLSRHFLAGQDTPNRQVILITDGLPTAHFEGEQLYLLYPPDPRTEAATLREAGLCAREGITINIFLLPSWSQTSEDIQFAYRLAENTQGRVFFTAGRDLDRYVIWDYLHRRRDIVG